MRNDALSLLDGFKRHSAATDRRDDVGVRVAKMEAFAMQVPSNAGLLPNREIDKRLGLSHSLAAVLNDGRDPDLTGVAPLVNQPILSRFENAIDIHSQFVNQFITSFVVPPRRKQRLRRRSMKTSPCERSAWTKR